MAKKSPLATQEEIEAAVLLVRGEKVLLDADLANFYGVTTKALNQAVKRNRSRFPEDFMFRLTAKETTRFNRSQSVTGSQKHRDPRYRRLPSPSREWRCSREFYAASGPC